MQHTPSGHTPTICPTCLGDGSIETLGAPGWFSMDQECYYPTEHLEPCPSCHATGVVWEVAA